MRIVYVLTSLGVGGAERQVLAIAAGMAARGHAVSLLVLRPRQQEQWPTELEVVYLDMHKTARSALAGLMRARAFLNAFRPDLIHSHNFHGNILARLLRMFHRRTALVCTIHNVYEGGRLRMLAYRLTDRFCEITTAVSRAAAERYVRLRAVPAAKCMVLTNGIDTAAFSARPERRIPMRLQMDVRDEFVWLAAGRIVPAKDFPNLLRAFERVRAFFPAAQLWIAGEGHARGLKQEARPGEESDAVRWLGLRRDMRELLDAADGFVLSSAWEGMPLALGEAMAMEKAVAATDVGGVRELVGEAGMVVPARDSSALAEAMLAVMRTSPEARQAQGRGARRRICERFSLQTRIDEWEALYHAVSARQ